MAIYLTYSRGPYVFTIKALFCSYITEHYVQRSALNKKITKHALAGSAPEERQKLINMHIIFFFEVFFQNKYHMGLGPEIDLEILDQSPKYRWL